MLHLFALAADAVSAMATRAGCESKSSTSRTAVPLPQATRTMRLGCSTKKLAVADELGGRHAVE